MGQSPRGAPPPVSSASGDADRLLAEGRALHARGRPQEAFGRYQRALALVPDNPEAQHLLGVAYASLGQAPIAVAFMRRAVTSRPDVADYRVNLATALAGLGQLDEAERELQAACALAPADVAARAELAALQRRLSRLDDAEQTFAQAAALAPQRADLHEALAQLQYRRGALPEAVASAGRASALSAAAASRLNIGFAHHATPLALPPPAPRVKADARIGPQALAEACAERDLVVWDDFLDDPQASRETALALCAEAARASVLGNFPGVQSLAQDCQATMQRIADALGRPVKWDSPDNGALRVSLASDEARADVHVDNPTLPRIFGGVLCLTLPQHCRGGTGFYRHRGTGWARRPDPVQLQERGFASFLDFQRRCLPANRRQSFDQWHRQRDATWEWLFEVPLRFNRLVLFRSDFFHAITDLFGDAPGNGRLMQLFHFEALADR
jgi:Flp pilus assembly protein TadD